MARRIAIGGFAQESNSFSPITGSWDHFGPSEVLADQSLITTLAGTRTELGAVIGDAEPTEIDLIPLLYARASSSAGPMRRDVFDAILDDLVKQTCVAGDLDGVLLALHGAMLVEGLADGTGEILRATRQALGPDIPLVGTLDLHANVTAQMVAQATALVGYHTAPHVDQAKTGLRAFAILRDILADRTHPVCALRRLPMILPGETARTTDGPYAEVMAMAEEAASAPAVLDASVFSVQPWLDVEDVGCSVLVTTNNRLDLAEREAQRLAEAFWQRRQRFDVTLTPTAIAIHEALDSARGPYVLADSADAPSSGAPGDSTIVLRALLAAEPTRPCLHNIVDAPAVAQLVAAGVGATVTVTLGARQAPAFYDPVQVTGSVRLIADGDFIQKGNADCPGRGDVLHRGRTVVLKIGAISLVVMERPVNQWDPELYRSLGLEPTEAQVVIVKSPAGFRAAYEPLAAEIRLLDAPGVCSPHLRALPFRHVRRPLYPLDEGRVEWGTESKGAIGNPQMTDGDIQ